MSKIEKGILVAIDAVPLNPWNITQKRCRTVCGTDPVATLEAAMSDLPESLRGDLRKHLRQVAEGSISRDLATACSATTFVSVYVHEIEVVS